ncbi:MAG: laminin G [Lentisphaeria bacterium]|nr:laminin G [Lentisphaeria bacterium]
MKFKIFYLSLVASISFFSANGAEVSSRKMAWAHYVPWHSPLNNSLTAFNYYNFPLQDSTGNSHKDWQKEISLAQASGIDGFFVDIVADKNGGATIFFPILQSLLEASQGSDFQVGICLDVKTNVQQQVRELKKMLDRIGNHPNYPRWQGKPVIATYTYLSWKPEELAAIRSELKKSGHDIFLIGNVDSSFQKINEKKLHPHLVQADMIYSFGMMEIDKTSIGEKAKRFEQIADKFGKFLMATVYPGYYGAWLNGRNDYYQVHCGFDQAHRCYEAIPVKAQWIHYTTWNDHDETSFMPMIFTPANPMITKIYTDRFKGNNTITGKPEVVVAYHREETAGTLLRIEALTLPTMKSGNVTVKGRLLDEKGKMVFQLPAKSLAGNSFDRAEWLIPTITLAQHPVLIPEFTINNGQQVRLPEVITVAGWQQNAVTVKIAASKVFTPQSTLHLKESKDGLIQVSGNYNSPEKLKRVSLWCNDRPVAVISPETEKKTLLNLLVSRITNFAVTPQNGTIISASKKFTENNTPKFKWNAASLKAHRNARWAPVAISLAGTPALSLQFSIISQNTFSISAAELLKRGEIEVGGGVIKLSEVDATMQNSKSLNCQSGTFNFELFRKARPQDRWQLCFESTDGRIGWSLPVWPFARKREAFPVKLLENSITLETAANETGWTERSEYLSEKVPFKTPQVKDARISPLSLRGGHWDFEKNGCDSYGDMSLTIPAGMYCPGAPEEGSALRFTGKEAVKMRRRTYPMEAATIDFLIHPEGGAKKRQGIITRTGWSSALNIYLLSNGKIEVIRDGHNKFKEEKVTSAIPLPLAAWSRVRVTFDNETICIYINGTIVARKVVSPQKSHGNCTWYLGKGDKRSVNFTGKLDALTVFGTAFAPGNQNEPQFGRPVQLPPYKIDNGIQVDTSSSVSGSWKFPAQVEKVPETAKETTEVPQRYKQILDHTGTLTLGHGVNVIGKVEAQGVELTENTIVTVKLHKFERLVQSKSWYALLISIGNDENKKFNFNFGRDDSKMINEMKPKWKIRTGPRKVKLPAVLQIAKQDGFLIFLLNEERVFMTKDDPEHPFTKLSFQTSSPNRADAVAIRLDPPILNKLKSKK